METQQVSVTVIVGAGARGIETALAQAGVTDVVTLERAVLRSEFDEDTDSWTLHTDQAPVQARVVIATDQTRFTPWIPDIDGRSDFRGEYFHAADWDRYFHPDGKRVAVLGTDSWAGHRLGQLIESARSVTVFPLAPRRVVTDMPRWTTRATRRLLRRRPDPGPEIGSAVTAITTTGIRTHNGIEHGVDAIVYGTGFATVDETLIGVGGRSLREAWQSGMEPFAGVAVHGFPNYFVLVGPDIPTQARYIAHCVAEMQRTGSRRIEVRRSSQQVFNERAHLGPISTPAPTGAFETFELSSGAPEYEDTYDGAATLEINGTRHPVRVRLTGHLDPLDGNYHWQGTAFDVLPDDSLKASRAGTLRIGQRSAPARIVEKTPWGTHSVAGMGAPPYPR
ncbi:DUF4873 domain-containing protein [Mycobacterium vicinigordonae]|uniref:DUF4873 domain-containing protein n=1 Tax=Mycobacterium vicinigordonae TaxID=1719132 RepID=A0A7D6E010_9MYCO|nr:DUF4873 domain-containing protein [Mycobacterium vicinigordonae]QLL06641.1 DUF4873 domain-containing protein [Mycobacterium vicinigordonae]